MAGHRNHRLLRIRIEAGCASLASTRMTAVTPRNCSSCELLLLHSSANITAYVNCWVYGVERTNIDQDIARCKIATCWPMSAIGRKPHITSDLERFHHIFEMPSSLMPTMPPPRAMASIC